MARLSDERRHNGHGRDRPGSKWARRPAILRQSRKATCGIVPRTSFSPRRSVPMRRNCTGGCGCQYPGVLCTDHTTETPASEEIARLRRRMDGKSLAALPSDSAGKRERPRAANANKNHRLGSRQASHVGRGTNRQWCWINYLLTLPSPNGNHPDHVAPGRRNRSEYGLRPI